MEAARSRAVHGRLPRAGTFLRPGRSAVSYPARSHRLRRNVPAGGAHAARPRPARRAHPLSRDRRAVEPRALKRTLAVGVTAILVAALAAWAVHASRGGGARRLLRSDAHAPEGVRVRV